MGQIQPIASKAIDSFQNAVAAVAMQGRRKAMEDTHQICVLGDRHPDIFFAAVYDGHGGDEVAKYLRDHLHEKLDQSNDPMSEAEIRRAFLDVDSDIRNKGENASFVVGSKDGEEMRHCGAAAVVALIQPVKNAPGRFQVTIANCGDSGALLVASTAHQALTKDHKPENEIERKRIEAAGMAVWNGRVAGDINLSRAFGDHAKFKSQPNIAPEKQPVSVEPDVSRHTWQAGDDAHYLVLYCDGITESLKESGQIAEVVRTKKAESKSTTDHAASVLSAAFCAGSSDNHSLILVDLVQLARMVSGTSGRFQIGDKKSEYRPGPYSWFYKNKEWRQLYLADAQRHGFGADRFAELMELSRHAEKDMPMPPQFESRDDYDYPLSSDSFVKEAMATADTDAKEMLERQLKELKDKADVEADANMEAPLTPVLTDTDMEEPIDIVSIDPQDSKVATGKLKKDKKRRKYNKQHKQNAKNGIGSIGTKTQ